MCNPNYLGGCDKEDQGSGSAWANISQDHISKIIRAKWTGDVAQAIERLPHKFEALNSNPVPPKKINK
jgi:hypothetical protein